jgi:hypothetical protein
LKWLGFMIDSEEQMFKVGDAKVAKLKTALQEALFNPTISPRKLAALAGQIIAVSPAVLPAALYSRGLFEAMQGKVSWDQVFPTPQSVSEIASFWLANLDRFNGRRWWPRPVQVEVTVDASGVGFGGAFTTGPHQRIPFSETFTSEQTLKSSTEREIRGYTEALLVIAQHFPENLKGASVLLYGDNQGAISDLNKLRSSVPGIQENLKRVFGLCCEFDFDLVAKWIPKEELTEADELSRKPDTSDWAISQATYEDVLGHFAVRPALDVFASDASHVTSRFISQF